MQFFIGIVPPNEYKQKIVDFRNKWKNNQISEVVEPHITLKAQGGLAADKKWMSKIETVCRDFPSFQIEVNAPKFFGEDILYLTATSRALYDLHNRIVEVIAPSEDLIQQYFERHDFVPHMTLAKTTYGLTKTELVQMAKAAEIELSPFPTFDVSFVRVYQEMEDHTYQKLLDIPINNETK